MIRKGGWSLKKREEIEKAVVQIKKEHPEYTQREVSSLVEISEQAVRNIYNKHGIKTLNQPKPRVVVKIGKAKTYIDKKGRFIMEAKMVFVKREFSINTNKLIELKEY